MDSGHLEEGETPEDDYDVAQTLSPGQIIWMMDELFTHEVAMTLIPSQDLSSYGAA